MFGVVVGVQQLEAHVLQPFLMGRLVSVHPLGVIIAIALGVIVAGIPGALIAVPLAASLNAVVQHLANYTEVGEDPEDAAEDDRTRCRRDLRRGRRRRRRRGFALAVPPDPRLLSGAQRDLLDEQRQHEGDQHERHGDQEHVVERALNASCTSLRTAAGSASIASMLLVSTLPAAEAPPGSTSARWTLRRLDRIAPKSAAPNVPPIERKNATELVAMPMCGGPRRSARR